MKNAGITVLSLTLMAAAAAAQNPIVPPGVYMADPAAHVWPDGRVYVYGSKDENANYFCSQEYHVLSSADMVKWQLTRRTFASSGIGDEVPFNDRPLYAPDCQYRDSLYYLYFCSDNWDEGVATSDSPLGPFICGTEMKLEKRGIDPCVFVDDDGQAYYIWGQFSAKIAKLQPDMMAIDTSTIIDGLVTERMHNFHEGAWMAKRKGIYYLVYADISRADRPSCLGYATAKSPTGPFTYRGVIVDNNRCDPSNWTNHGSLIEFNGLWYIFYHRSTHNTFSMRKPCIEPVYFTSDGLIPEVEMTTQGAAPPLDARKPIDAERACLLAGSVYIAACAPDNEQLVNIRNGDRATYKYINFGLGVDSVVICVRPGFDGGQIGFAIDQHWHGDFVTVDVPKRIDAGAPLVIGKKLDRKVTGVHSLWLRFSGSGNDLFDVDWLQFK